MARRFIAKEVLYETWLSSKNRDEICEKLQITRRELNYRVAQLRKTLRDMGLPELPPLPNEGRRQDTRNRLLSLAQKAKSMSSNQQYRNEEEYELDNEEEYDDYEEENRDE